MQHTWMRGVVMICQIGRYLQTEVREYENLRCVEIMREGVVMLKRLLNECKSGNKYLSIVEEKIYNAYNEFLVMCRQ